MSEAAESFAQGYDFPSSVEVAKRFYEFSQIPRKSKNEKAIAAYVQSLFPEEKYEIRRDTLGNFAIDIPATPGYENAPRVVLHSHLDMVCASVTGHPSPNDEYPTQPFIQSGVIQARGTSLGMDNGGGMAIAVAIAKDENLPHGPLTLLFTVDEETGLHGARGMDLNLIPSNAAFLFSLDGEREDLIFGSAGGSIITSEMNKKTEEVPVDCTPLQIDVDDLPGGHSGVDMHRNPLNALLLLNQLLKEIFLKLGDTGHLVSLEAKHACNQIPKNAHAVIAVPEERKAEIEELIEKFFKQQKSDHPEKAKDLKIDHKVPNLSPTQAISREIRDRLISLLDSLPQGPLKLFGNDPNSVEDSNNVAMISTLGELIKLEMFLRATETESLNDREAGLLAQLKEAGFTYQTDKFPGYRGPRDGLALKVVARASKRVRGYEVMKVLVHGAAEFGVITERLAEIGRQISSVLFGIPLEGIHTPDEKVKTVDIHKTYQIVTEALDDVLDLRPGNRLKILLSRLRRRADCFYRENILPHFKAAPLIN